MIRFRGQWVQKIAVYASANTDYALLPKSATKSSQLQKLEAEGPVHEANTSCGTARCHTAGFSRGCPGAFSRFCNVLARRFIEKRNEQTKLASKWMGSWPRVFAAGIQSAYGVGDIASRESREEYLARMSPSADESLAVTPG